MCIQMPNQLVKFCVHSTNFNIVHWIENKKNIHSEKLLHLFNLRASFGSFVCLHLLPYK